MKSKKSSSYDEGYFEDPEKNGYGGYDNNDWYKNEAEKLFMMMGIKTALDFGCAKGPMVANLVKYGVHAYGIDTSEYATSHLVEGAEGRVLLGDETDLIMFKDQSFELVVSMATLEHLEQEDSEFALGELVRISKRYLYLTIPWEGTPEMHKDVTHVNVQSKEYWLKLFEDFELELIEHEIIDDPCAFLLEKKWRKGK